MHAKWLRCNVVKVAFHLRKLSRHSSDSACLATLRLCQTQTRLALFYTLFVVLVASEPAPGEDGKNFGERSDRGGAGASFGVAGSLFAPWKLFPLRIIAPLWYLSCQYFKTFCHGSFERYSSLGERYSICRSRFDVVLIDLRRRYGSQQQQQLQQQLVAAPSFDARNILWPYWPFVVYKFSFFLS